LAAVHPELSQTFSLLIAVRLATGFPPHRHLAFYSRLLLYTCNVNLPKIIF
jgi:hypothetical protein